MYKSDTIDRKNTDVKSQDMETDGKEDAVPVKDQKPIDDMQPKKLSTTFDD